VEAGPRQRASADVDHRRQVGPFGGEVGEAVGEDEVSVDRHWAVAPRENAG
jgi:hypothetical protein